MQLLNLLILISIFQYGQSLTLTLSELDEWKKQMRAELKLEIKTEIFQELPETEEDITRIDTQLGNVVKTSQEIISAVQDLSVQLQSLQEFTQEVNNHTTQVENIEAELQETNSLVENQSTELNRFENELIGFNETLQESNNALNYSIADKANELHQLLRDIESLQSQDKVELIRNMTEMKMEMIGDQAEALQESEISLNNSIALQTIGFHRLLEEIKKEQKSIMDGIKTDIETEFLQQIGETKEFYKTNLLEMFMNATEIKDAMDIDVTEAKNQLEDLTSNVTNFAILITDVQKGKVVEG
jgi:myosin heavy subunit